MPPRGSSTGRTLRNTRSRNGSTYRAPLFRGSSGKPERRGSCGSRCVRRRLPGSWRSSWRRGRAAARGRGAGAGSRRRPAGARRADAGRAQALGAASRRRARDLVGQHRLRGSPGPALPRPSRRPPRSCRRRDGRGRCALSAQRDRAPHGRRVGRRVPACDLSTGASCSSGWPQRRTAGSLRLRDGRSNASSPSPPMEYRARNFAISRATGSGRWICSRWPTRRSCPPGDARGGANASIRCSERCSAPALVPLYEAGSRPIAVGLRNRRSQVRILTGACSKGLYRAKSGPEREGAAPPGGNKARASATRSRANTTGRLYRPAAFNPGLSHRGAGVMLDLGGWLLLRRAVPIDASVSGDARWSSEAITSVTSSVAPHRQEGRSSLGTPCAAARRVRRRWPNRA